MYSNEKQFKSDNVFKGRVISVFDDIVELDNGNKSRREYAKHNGAVCIIPITYNGEVVLERQYRYAVGKVMTEIPAGKLETNEDRLEAAKRELEEETGYKAGRIVDLGDFYGSPAILDERVTMYLATDLTKGETNYDADEFMEVFTMPLKEAVEKALNNEFDDGKTQLCILKAWMYLNR